MLEYFDPFQENTVRQVVLCPYGPKTADVSVFIGQLNKKYWTCFLPCQSLLGQGSTNELAKFPGRKSTGNEPRTVVRGWTVCETLIRDMEKDLGCIQMPFLGHQVSFLNYRGLRINFRIRKKSKMDSPL